MLLHSDRYSLTGVSTRKTGVVVHDSESSDGSAAVLVAMLQKPGDRPLGNGRTYGAGYHAVTDGNGGYTVMADAVAGPFHAPPANKAFWSICMPGRAAQTRDEWLDPLSRNHIRGVAKFIYDKSLIDRFALERLSSTDLLAGDSGYCGHADVSMAWGLTDHTDPGKNFPWDVLADDIEKLKPVPEPPEEEDDMLPIVTNAEEFKGAPAGQAKWALMDDGILRWMDPVEWQTRGSKDGVPWLNDSLARHGA